MAIPSEARLNGPHAAESGRLPNQRAKFRVWVGGLAQTTPKTAASGPPVSRARFNRALILSVAAPFLLMTAITVLLLWSISDLQTGRFTGHVGVLLILIVGVSLAAFAAYELVSLSRAYQRSLSRSDALSSELGRREAHFRNLAEAIPQMVWTCAPDGSPEYFNQRWHEYVGGAQSSRQPWLERVHVEDEACVRQNWEACVASGKAFTDELRLRSLAANYRWHLARALPLRNESGTIVRWLGTFTDIDDQKRAEEALLRLASIIETSDDAIYSKDLQGIVTSWNSSAERMYGYSAEEIVGKPVSTLSPPEKLQETDEILRRVRCGELVEHYETVRLRKDGKLLEVSLAISPIRTASGLITGASTIARDVTERNRAADALRKTEKLAATGRLAGTMAHEINNPLEAVTHLIYLLQHNPSLDAQAREYAQLAADEVSRIGHIAKQALGFYREAAAPTEVNISDLLRDVVQLYAAGAQNKTVKLAAELESQATVPAFPGEMRQVFSNLIVNAVDAVPRGGTVRARVKDGRDWKTQARGIRVLVADNGPGIPAALRKRIFEPFFTTKGERGTGVGLWVSEGVVQKHSGCIRLKSSTGRSHGTTFSVFLPY